MNIIAKIAHTEFLLPDIETAKKIMDLLGNAPQVTVRYIHTKEFKVYVMTDDDHAESVEFRLEKSKQITREEFDRLKGVEVEEARSAEGNRS